MISVNDLKSKIASGAVFAGFDGGLSDRLDWWAGIRYYNSSGRRHCSPGHTVKMLGWECYKRPQSQFERGFEWCGWNPGSLGRVRQSGPCQELLKMRELYEGSRLR